MAQLIERMFGLRSLQYLPAAISPGRREVEEGKIEPGVR